MRRRQQLLLLLVLMLFSSLAEIVSIGAVIPFLAALTAPEKLLVHESLAPLMKWFEITAPDQLQLSLTVLFILGALLAGAMRVLLSWSSIRLAYAIGADLSYSIYWRTLCQPYPVHVGRNSSQIVTAIVTKVSVVIAGVISPILMLASSAFLLVTISGILFAVDTRVTLAAFLSFGAIYLFVIKATNALKLRSGQTVAVKSTQVVKALQEGLGGIRDILLDSSQKTYCEVYREADIPLRKAQSNVQFVAQSPRFVIEAIGMVIIAAIALILSRRAEGITAAMPVLGALAIGAQRLMPVMQQAYMSWSTLTSTRAVFEEALELLEQSVPADALLDHVAILPFARTIQLRNVSFKYGKETPCILDDVNLVIEKGSRVGVVGSTGSGKSTLIDLIMGLLRPDSGGIEIDGVPVDETNLKGWQRHIAHVPQSIFLTDNTIAENIAFGIPQDRIDLERVRRVAAQAQIASDVEGWPNGYGTRVGERGICLSGGQRQRIGIARALYKNADVIVFDEATSALDGETEKAVMEAIETMSPNITIIIIAHRLSTLKGCTNIIELVKEGKLRVRTCDEICEIIRFQ